MCRLREGQTSTRSVSQNSSGRSRWFSLRWPGKVAVQLWGQNGAEGTPFFSRRESPPAKGSLVTGCPRSGPTSGPGKVAGRFGVQNEARGTPFFLRRESPPVKRLWPKIIDIVVGKSGGPVSGAERGDFFPRREGPPAKGSLVDPSPRSYSF